MLATNFNSSNIVIGPPEGTSEDVVNSINACVGTVPDHAGALSITTCFRPTQAELTVLLNGGGVYLTMLTSSLPAHLLSTEDPVDTGFVEPIEGL